MQGNRIKILVCCHKADQHKSDDVYMPIHVGKALCDFDLGMQGDDEGDNISSKNGSYCELTGLFWAWKNLKGADYIGLSHYRRYFKFHRGGNFLCNISVFAKNFDGLNLDLPNLSDLFSDYDVVLAKRIMFKCSIFDNYRKNHYGKDFELVEKIVLDKFPEYEQSIKYLFHDNNGLSAYNMFIMSWTEFDRYCTWLFSILDDLESQLDISNYDSTQKRVYGYMSERLLNLYVYHNRLRPKYLPIYMVGSKSKSQTIIRYYKRVLIFKITKLFKKRGV